MGIYGTSIKKNVCPDPVWKPVYTSRPPLRSPPVPVSAGAAGKIIIMIIIAIIMIVLIVILILIVMIIVILIVIVIVIEVRIPGARHWGHFTTSRGIL